MDNCSLIFGEKGNACCEKFFSLHRRFPQLLPKHALRELGSFLSNTPETFLESRTNLHLARIFFSLHRLIHLVREGGGQRLHHKSFKISPSIYGIVIALVTPNEEERINEKHILKGVQNLIPGIIPINGSYFTYQLASNSFYYLEVKKMRGAGFLKTERQKLQVDLIHELQKAIETPSNALFFPGNEEELFKNIHHLSREIRYVNDLPQVMITFVEYFNETLKFLVIVLRVLKPNTPSLLSLSTHLPSLIHFSLEKVFCVGRLRNKHPKEASIFTLEVQSSPFSRGTQAVNLRSARLYIVKAIESMLGPFRDYNGGLLYKENEQFLAIKRALIAKGTSCPALEDLFYGIKPMEMRPLLSVETGVELAKLFQKMSEQPANKSHKYCHSFFRSKDLHLAVIKTAEKGWRASLPARVLSEDSHIGCSILEREGFLYFCFFVQYPSSDRLFNILEEELTQHTTLSTYSRQMLLHLNFQSGDPLSLNPRLAADMPCHILSNLLFEGLTRINRAGSAQPAAADIIEISTCGTIYTFHLKQAWWSNGEEVTAYHFERAWKKALILNQSSYPYPDFFYLIKNVSLVREQALPLEAVGIEAKDARTLSVQLEAPCPYFLDLLSTPPFFPMLGEGEEPSDFNGPFTVAEWKRNISLHLSQNPFYRESKQIKLGGIKISMIRDPYQAFEIYKQGGLDFIGDPTTPLPPDLIKIPDVQSELVEKSIPRIFWIHCNLRQFPLNNRFLRQALSFAINRKSLTEKVFLHQTPQFSPLPTKYATVQGNEKGNPQLAVELFEKALKDLGHTHSSFPTLVLTHSDLSFEKPLFEELKAQWKDVLGINIAPRQLRWTEFSAAIEKGNFQLCGLFRRDFFNNALFYLSFFKPSPSNPHSLDNPVYLNLLNQLEQGKMQEGILKEIEQLLIEEMPVIPLVNQRFLALIASHVKGIGWDANGCLDLKEVSIHENSH